MDGEFYRAKLRDAEYETLFRLALSALASEDYVIVNALLGKELRDLSFMEELKEKAHRQGAGLIAVWILSSPSLCRARMEKQGAERDAKKLADFDAYAKGGRYDPPFSLAEKMRLTR